MLLQQCNMVTALPGVDMMGLLGDATMGLS